MIKTKKATIGATMTWVVATIIILFVMIVFVYTSVALFGKGELKPILSIKGGQISSSADSEQMLLDLLHKKIGDKEVKEIIIEGEEGLIKTDLIRVFNNVPDCLDYSNEGSWLFEKYSKEDLKMSIGNTESVKKIKDFKFSVFFYAKDKRIEFYEECVVPGIWRI